MKTQLVKWNNDLAIRLTRPLAEKAGFKEGDFLEIEAREGEIELHRKVKVPSLAKLVREISRKNRYQETSTGPHVGKESTD